jgi:hypothetical protein
MKPPLSEPKNSIYMKLYRILLALVATTLCSCSSYQVKTAQTENHRCYSEWHYLPSNS